MPSELAERLARDTAALCRIPSVTGDEAAIAAHIAARLDPRGQRIGNAVIARGPDRGRPLVVLAGHIDTVPGEVPVRVLGGRVHGRGASDMKGALAVMLALFEDLDLDALPVDLGLVFYDGEEGPFDQNGLGLLLEQVEWIRRAALVFCLEPSDNEVQLGCVGTLHARVVVTGRAAHSARPWQGENAIHAAGPFLTWLSRQPPREVRVGGLDFREVLSATLAAGGRARNVVPDRFELNLNYRFAPGRSMEDAIAEVRRVVATHLPGASVEIVDCCPAGRVVTDNPLLQRFLSGAPVGPKQGWTDVARLTQAGVDAVNIGPGLSAQAHQDGEYAEIDLLVEAYHRFRRFLSASP